MLRARYRYRSVLLAYDYERLVTVGIPPCEFCGAATVGMPPCEFCGVVTVGIPPCEFCGDETVGIPPWLLAGEAPERPSRTLSRIIMSKFLLVVRSVALLTV